MNAPGFIDTRSQRAIRRWKKRQVEKERKAADKARMQAIHARIHDFSDDGEAGD